MIKSIKHKGLKNYWFKNQSRGLNQDNLKRLTMLMNALDVATNPNDLNFPGTRFHPLIGDRNDQYAVLVSGNLRLIFEWEEQDATNVDLVDYH